jgi:hypothetical protein
MNPYVNEEVMWQRLKDVQLEAENRRLMGLAPSLLDVAWTLGKHLWMLVRPARRPVSAVRADERPSASDAA